MSLKQGERQTVQLKIDVPENAAPGDYTSVVFSEMKIALEQKGVSLKLVGRVGCRISLRIAGDIIEKLKVTSLRVKSFVIGNKLP